MKQHIYKRRFGPNDNKFENIHNQNIIKKEKDEILKFPQKYIVQSSNFNLLGGENIILKQEKRKFEEYKKILEKENKDYNIQNNNLKKENNNLTKELEKKKNY